MSDDRRDEAFTAAIRGLEERGAAQAERIDSLELRLEQLLQILEGKEVLAAGHRRLIARVGERGKRTRETRVRLGKNVDKYELEGPDIDCASRIPLCHARCCSFQVELSKQDVEEGELAWKIEEPYLLLREDDGYCTYLEPEGRCGCYEARPATCRTYDCRNDERVWIDFEARIPAPMPTSLFPLADVRRRRT